MPGLSENLVYNLLGQLYDKYLAAEDGFTCTAM